MKWLLALFLFVLAGAAAAPAQETRIAAVVNDDIVTGGDLIARLKLVMVSSNIPDTPENRQRLKSQVLRTLIDEKLQMQEAKRLGVSIPQSEVDASLAGIEQRNNMQKGQLDTYLEQQGVARSTLASQITASLAFAKVVRNRLSQDVSVSDDEVSDAMKRMQSDIGKPQSRLSEIFLSIDNPSQEADVRSLAERLIEQIRGGANFGAVAQQFSQSPSAAVGGDIGWMVPSQLSPLLGEAIEKMNPGQMSYPIHTPAGYYILYLVDRKTLGTPNPAEIMLALDEVIFQEPPNATADDRQRIMTQAQHVSDTAKSCGEMAKFGQELAPQLSRQLPRVRASDLPDDQREEILALRIAEASKPIPEPGFVGVVMVCQRTDPPGLPTRDEITENIARARLDTLARRYMRNLRRDAFVDIRG